MAIGKKQTPPSGGTAVASPQTGRRTHPYGRLSALVPTRAGSLELFRLLREAVPIIDAAIMKTVRLLGTFNVFCDEAQAQAKLRAFLRTVPVGALRHGIDSFLSTYFEQLLTYGTAIGEMVLTDGHLTDLYNADLRCTALSYGSSPLDIVVSAQDESGHFVPVPWQALILKSVHDPEPGALYGTSILRGLPFISDILLTIFQTTGVNWERLGNVRFAVTYKPQNDALRGQIVRWRDTCAKRAPCATLLPWATCRCRPSAATIRCCPARSRCASCSNRSWQSSAFRRFCWV